MAEELDVAVAAAIAPRDTSEIQKLNVFVQNSGSAKPGTRVVPCLPTENIRQPMLCDFKPLRYRTFLRCVTQCNDGIAGYLPTALAGGIART